MKLLWTVPLALSLGVTVAAAQQQPGYPGGSMPGQQQPGTTPQTMPGQNEPSQTNPNQQPSETKLKGCVESQGGNYVLREKHDKMVALTGSQDLAEHAGHTVVVHGKYQAGYANKSDTSQSSKDSSKESKNGAREFAVSRVDMVSDSCVLDKGKDKDKTKPSGAMNNPGEMPNSPSQPQQ